MRGDKFLESLSLDPNDTNIEVRADGSLLIMHPRHKYIIIGEFAWYCQDRPVYVLDCDFPQSKDRTEYNQYYVWSEDLQCWYTRHENLVGGKRANNVLVFPPSASRSEWWVLAPASAQLYPLIGEDAEKRAFSIAVGLVTQITGENS
jgi:hypothetical protein